MLTELVGRPVLVTGAGISGLAAAEALLGLGAEVTITDDDAERWAAAPDGVRRATGLRVPPAGTVLVVTSPGWRPDSPVLAAAAAEGIEVIGEPELAWRVGVARAAAEGGEAPAWLAVTGTNGKTTTVGMLSSILLAAGEDAVACGNIGLPVVTAVLQRRRVLAVELSSFQLHWSPSIRPDAGCVLNVAEDHLDWHGSMAAYAAAKGRVLRGDVAIASRDDKGAAALLAAAQAPRRVGITLAEPAAGQLGVAGGVLLDRAFTSGARRPAGVELAGTDDVHPAGPPGLLDALAAAALARAHGVPAAAVQAGLRAFRPGLHRSELVASVAGVDYVDDSKATNPHAAAASLAGHSRVVWIAGGLLKGASAQVLGELVIAHRHRLAGVVLLGADRRALAAAMARHAPDVPVVEVTAGDHEPMTEAVRLSAALARPGDVVLLAPAAASMDQFTDYAARGRAFAAAVAMLLGAAR